MSKRARSACVSVLSLAAVAAVAAGCSNSDAETADAPATEATGSLAATTSDPCALIGPEELAIFSSKPEAEPMAGSDKISTSCAWDGDGATVVTVTLQNSKTEASKFKPETKIDLGGIAAYADASVADFCTVYVPAPDEDKTLIFLATPDAPTAEANPATEDETWCDRAEPAISKAVAELGWA
ncbi:DUF3558 family protein [Rhodococcus rhodnii]|uniref:DUF3558 family protein n=1 Tax=Rhodococcus rhodnii TaxID=38312 RepID=UPI000A73D759|nr:DUF3558 family protein [Rhodococcus rhodnii]